MQLDTSADRPVVLVVDDAPSSLGVLCNSLEDAGYTVLVASDGETALQRLELVTPDAILLDGRMPGMSGFDTCRRIKDAPEWSHIPVIFMTGMSDTENVVEGFACGGVDYVVKPLRAQEVVARLHTHVRNARITRLAREAVDVAGLGVVFVDALGRIAWRSPQAAAWLDTLDSAAPPGQLPRLLQAALGSARGAVLRVATEPPVSVRNMGRATLGETMLLLELQREGSAAASRLAHAALTPRETEVLSWLAKGKTNRDIADILGMSPRTVNKHLEHIFEKLGVETRAAAAALASGQWR